MVWFNQIVKIFPPKKTMGIRFHMGFPLEHGFMFLIGTCFKRYCQGGFHHALISKDRDFLEVFAGKSEVTYALRRAPCSKSMRLNHSK